MADKKNKRFNNTGAPRIVTMASLRNPDREDDEQAYYAGGSEHSGQQVLGPGKRRHEDSSQFEESGSSLANAFKNVAEMQNAAPSGSAGRPRKFGGAGHRLGDASTTEEPEHDGLVLIDLTQDDSSDEMYDAPRLGPGQEGTDEPNAREQEVRVVLYENGFRVEDEPLRSYDDPTCANLKDYINKGQFPALLVPEHLRSTSVSMCVIDKRPESYKAPLIPPKPFAGKGHILGSPTPNLGTVEEGGDTAPEVPITTEEVSPAPSEPREYNFSNESSEPTVLRIRLPAGELISLTMNATDTILNIRERIIEVRPQLAARMFSLLSAFPRRVYDSMDETIEGCGLKNSCVTVKFADETIE